jgi:hypothetical protein
MPPAGFEPTIPVFERLKTVRTLDRATTGTGSNRRNDAIVTFPVDPATCLHIQWIQSKPNYPSRWRYQICAWNEFQTNSIRAPTEYMTSCIQMTSHANICFTSKSNGAYTTASVVHAKLIHNDMRTTTMRNVGLKETRTIRYSIPRNYVTRQFLFIHEDFCRACKREIQKVRTIYNFLYSTKGTQKQIYCNFRRNPLPSPQ